MNARHRFLTKVQVQPNGCWLWTGAPDANGYGTFYFERTRRAAHRAAWEIFRGAIPAGLDIDHQCHNEDPDCPGGPCIHRRCVNPEHLEPATRAENLRRGRTIIAAQVARTECPRGHPYDAENTYIGSRGERVCRTCQRNWHRRPEAKAARRERARRRAAAKLDV